MGDRRFPFATLMPSGPPVRPPTMLLAFGVWPLAIVFLLRGTDMGLGTIGMMIAPVSLGAFNRLRGIFPPSPGRRVVTGYAGLYLLTSAWIVVAQWTPIGVAMLALFAVASARAWLRPDESGIPTLEAQANRAVLEWRLTHTVTDDGAARPPRD